METIVVENLHKTFRVPHERYGSLKALALSFRRPRYQELHALRGISFTVQAGETVAVIGKNGAGKSTLLSILSKVYRPTSGCVVINGRVSGLLELGAGFHPDLTVADNVFLNGAILGLPRREIKRRFNEIISFAELQNFVDAPLRTCSSGMVMRLGFSIAVQVNPDVLLVDEVLAVGDESFQHKCYEKVRDFRRSGKTILFISHDLRAVREVASRVIWLDMGKIRADDAVEVVLDAYLRDSVP